MPGAGRSRILASMSAPHPSEPARDVVIVGGGIHGTAAAWFLAADPGFDGTVTIVERDPTFAHAATSLTNSCIRQQFSQPVNVAVSRFGAEFIRDLPARLDDPDAPRVAMRPYGYLYLADRPEQEAALREAWAVQSALGAATRLMAPSEIAERWPFYALDGIRLGSHNGVDEGWFDGAALFDGWRRDLRRRGVETRVGEVVDLAVRSGRVEAVRLADGSEIACGTLVVAAGTRSPRVAAMVGVALPIEPRRRFSYVFEAERPPGEVPLTIDPTGVHVRSEGPGESGLYLAGCPPPRGPGLRRGRLRRPPQPLDGSRLADPRRPHPRLRGDPAAHVLGRALRPQHARPERHRGLPRRGGEPVLRPAGSRATGSSSRPRWGGRCPSSWPMAASARWT